MEEKLIKKVFWILFSIALMTCSPDLLAKTVLKMNHQFPSTAAGSKIDQWFADQVEKATAGEVRIRIFWSNGLGDPKENLSLLRTGTIDMAAMSAGYFPEELSFFSAPNSIPMGMDNICQSSEIMKAFMDQIPAFSMEAKDHKIKPLFFHLLNPYLLVTKEPVRGLSDLKDKRIRTWGSDMPRLMEAAGAKPVPLFLPDIYEALKRGVIDGCPFSVDLIVSYKIYEQAKHITEVVLWEGPSWGTWISEKTWNRLNPDVQKIFMDTAQKARLKEIPATRQAEENPRRFLTKKGIQFHKFDSRELAKWEKASPDFFADLIKKLTNKGQKDAALQMLELWKKMRRQITCP